MEITQYVEGFSPDGQALVTYKMVNKSGASVQLCNIGAALTGVVVPDRKGLLADVVAGYQDINQYLNDPAHFGKTVGRYANRIANGKFTLEGTTYRLNRNNGPNHLHGGPQAMASKIWISRVEDSGNAVSFAYASPHNEEHYPGNVNVTVTYVWNDNNILDIELRAVTDQTTILNLTNHTYFNLQGEASGSIHDHLLQIHANHYLPTDKTSIPLGTPVPVTDTPFDFTKSKAIGQDIFADNEQLHIGNGYDHCWCLPLTDGSWQEAAVLTHPESGRKVSIHTTQPGIQIYTGNWLSGSGTSKNGKPHEDRHAIALECQNYPDSPNRPDYPNCVLKPGELYLEKIRYAFEIDN